MTKKEEIVNGIQSLSGKYSPETVFSNWVECVALVTQNSCYFIHNELWEQREKQYKNIMNRYELEERIQLREWFNKLLEVYEEEMSDVLGEIYMELKSSNKSLGQFFTPFHISELVAKMETTLKEQEQIKICEPSVGSGGMIIAVAKALKEKGINYQKYMKVTAQDLDWRSVYMSYVQFSFLGISAEIVQGDTLIEPYVGGKYPENRIFRTPRSMGVIL